MFTSKVPISHSSVLLLLHLDRLVWTRAAPQSSRNISVFLSSSPQHPGVRRSGHVFPLGQRWCCKALHPKLQHYPMWLKNNVRALVNNYWMRLSRRWRIMQIEEDVIHRARGWRPRWITSSVICIILHILRQLLLIQNICQFLTCLPPRRLFSKLWPISRHGFRI